MPVIKPRTPSPVKPRKHGWKPDLPDFRDQVLTVATTNIPKSTCVRSAPR